MNSTSFLITKIKAEEVKKHAEIFKEFRSTLSSDTSAQATRANLELCCAFWSVPSLSKSETSIKETFIGRGRASKERDVVLENCQRHMLRYDLNPSQAMLKLVQDALGELVDQAALDYNQAEVMSARLLDWREPQAIEERSERAEQLAQWLEIAQTESFDGGFTELMKSVFNGFATQDLALEQMRKRMAEMSRSTRQNLSFTQTSVKENIAALCSGDFLSGNQITELRKYTDKDTLQDVVDVLNLRVSSLENWKFSYPEEGAVAAHQRRKINGKYRVYFDYALLDAILIQEVGSAWASELREATRQYYNRAWFWPPSKRTKEDLERREFFLDERSGHLPKSMEELRQRRHQSVYFMHQLPTERHEHVGYDSDEDSDDEDGPMRTRDSAMESKHKLMQEIIADIKVRRHLGREVGFFQSDFKWFGPSLSHKTIFAACEFFGVSKFWQEWFEKVLKVRYKFKDQPVSIRKRGVPISTPFSDFASEMVLFVLEAAVNKATGHSLFRMADDFYFWATPKECTKAWAVVQQFVKASGCAINEEKTAGFGVDVGTSNTPKFMFLQLNDDEFKLDQAQLDTHIKEMKRQLDACDSVMLWIKAHNAYIRFIVTNLFRPFNALGIKHVWDIAESLRRIYIEVLGCSLHEYLAQRLGGVRGTWFWPLELGGFEVYDPFVELGEALEHYTIKTNDELADADKNDLACYERFRSNFEDRGEPRSERSRKLHEKYGEEPFMPLEEFMKNREETSTNLISARASLCEAPSPSGFYTTNKTIQAILAKPHESNRHINDSFYAMSSYWRAIVTTYGPELDKSFGSLQLVKRELVPLRLAVKLRLQKMTWQA